MTHADLINMWPSLAAFADDIRVGYMTAKGMRRRGSIPPAYWVRVVDAASRRAIPGIDFRRLAEMCALPDEMPEAAE
jgi:hypothetical protein